MEKKEKRRLACNIVGLILTIVATVAFCYTSIIFKSWIDLERDIASGQTEQLGGIAFLFLIVLFIIGAIAVLVTTIIGLSFSFAGIKNNKIMSIICIVIDGIYIISTVTYFALIVL